jgi:hypothetical protein
MEPSPPSYSKHRPSYFTPKIKFTPAEDDELRQAVASLGIGAWRKIAERVGSRNPRQCRERWKNYLDPQIRVASALPWTEEDDALLRQKYSEIGGKWNSLASFFPGRSTNNVKNRCRCLHRSRKRTSDQEKSGDEQNESLDPNLVFSIENPFPSLSIDSHSFFPSIKEDTGFNLEPQRDSTGDWVWF